MYTILKAINTNKVDYFSLDVEGGELEVLKGINLKKLDITTFQLNIIIIKMQEIILSNILKLIIINCLKIVEMVMHFS